MVGTSPIVGMVLLAVVAPYADTQGRFRLELAEGWSLAPRFGDPGGMVFSRAGVGHHPHAVQFEVRVEGRGMGPPAERAAAYLAAKTGRDTPSGQAARVGRYPAWRAVAQYEGTTPIAGPRVATVWALTADQVDYLLIFDRSRRDENRYRREVRAMLRSFVPTAPAPDPGRPKSTLSPPAEPPPEAAPVLVGRWRSAAGVELAFSADGRFILGDVFGRYVVRPPATLELERPNGTKERFSFEQTADQLVLRSNRLGKPAVYTRIERKDPPAVDRESLIGIWRALASQTRLLLKLERGGQFSLGPYTGTWTLEGDRIRLARNAQETVTYRFTFKKEVLWLSGGDLERQIAFVRER